MVKIFFFLSARRSVRAATMIVQLIHQVICSQIRYNPKLIWSISIDAALILTFSENEPIRPIYFSNISATLLAISLGCITYRFLNTPSQLFENQVNPKLIWSISTYAGSLTLNVNGSLEHQHQHCDNSAMMLAILFSFKTMELLQIGVTTNFQAIPLFPVRTLLLASLQSHQSLDANALCKRTLKKFHRRFGLSDQNICLCEKYKLENRCIQELFNFVFVRA